MSLAVDGVGGLAESVYKGKLIKKILFQINEVLKNYKK